MKHLLVAMAILVVGCGESTPEWEAEYRDRITRNFQEDAESDPTGTLEICATMDAMTDAELRSMLASVSAEGNTAFDETMADLGEAITLENTNRAIEISMEMIRSECPAS